MNPSAMCVREGWLWGKARRLERAQREGGACWAKRTPEDNWQFASTGCSFSLMRSPAAGRETFDNWVAVVGELSPDRGPSPQLALAQTCLTAAAEIWGLQRPSGIQSSVNNTKNNLRGLWHHTGGHFFDGMEWDDREMGVETFCGQDGESWPKLLTGRCCLPQNDP